MDMFERTRKIIDDEKINKLIALLEKNGGE